MLTPETLPSASKIFSSPCSGKFMLMGAELRGERIGTGKRRLFARSLVSPNSDSRFFSSSRFWILDFTISRSSEADLLPTSYLDAISSSSAAFSRSFAARCLSPSV
jgi:hypothetical protein